MSVYFSEQSMLLPCLADQTTETSEVSTQIQPNCLPRVTNSSSLKSALQVANTLSAPDAHDVPPSGSSSPGAEQKLELLTKQIAQQENTLIRLNTNFRIECTHVGKWKPRRLFLYNLAASGCGTAGSSSIASTRWNFYSHPRSMARSTAWSGPVCLFTSHCISLGAVLAETTIDLINDSKVRKKGFDINTTHKRVLAIKGDLDRLLQERQSILEHTDDFTLSDLELARAEGRVLTDVRDLSLDEYSQFFVRAHKFFANRAANSFMGMTAASTGGFGGTLFGILSAAHRRPRLVGTAGIGFLISGATIVATPGTGRVVANLAGQRARKKIYSQLNLSKTASSVSQLKADIAKLEQLASKTTISEHYNLQNLFRRLSAYDKQGKLFTAQNEINAGEIKKANAELKERMLFAALIGSSKMSWGINNINAGFGFQPRSLLRVNTDSGKARAEFINDPEPSRLFTERVAIAATTYIPGQGLWIFDTLQNRTREEMRNRTLASQGQLPGALNKERLDRVDEIDAAFNY